MLTTPRLEAVSRLARVLMESTIAAWVSHNPHHDREKFRALTYAGKLGYARLAAVLYDRGVRLTEGR